jgi:acetyl-CoA carboxylase carboxyltransferase component
MNRRINTPGMESKIQELRQRKEEIKQQGGAKAIAKMHEQGMLTARERIEGLFDPGSFVELDIFVKHHCTFFGMDKREIPAEGVITGYGKINGRLAFAYSQDFTALGGAYGEMHGYKICKVMDLAAESGAPIVGLCHSGGLRLHEVMGPMKTFAYLFYRNSIYSGVVPQISAIMGSVAGGQSYSPGLTDFIVMTKKSAMYIAGPAFVETQLGEKSTEEELGGAIMHAHVSGVCHVLTENDEDCLAKIKELLSYLPSSNREKPPFTDTGDDPNRMDEELNTILPDSSKKPYDMHKIINRIVDNGKLFEIHKDWARSMIVGFARLGGYSVGIVASQPMFLAGSIDVWAAEKASRFIRFCDAFNIPIIYLQDTPAYLIGREQESLGMIYRGATLLHATSEATVPQITVLIRKAYAGAYIAMGSKHLGTDQVFAWPSAEVCTVAPETTASVIFRKEIASAEHPEERRQQLLKEFHDKFVNPYHVAELQHIDDVIEPKETRPRVISALRMLKDKKKELPWRKHGNMPL